jgi:diguanylate cyclase (GGDEF)-like protein
MPSQDEKKPAEKALQTRGGEAAANALRRGPVSRLVVLGCLLVALLGLIDFWTGTEIAIFSLYLVPVALCTWYGNRVAGLFIAVLSSITWLTADVLSRRYLLHPLIYVWNTGTAVATLCVVAWLLSSVRNLLDVERSLARSDPVTGALNYRSFLDALRSEVERGRRYRHAFTLAYMDMDDFKSINDRLGHTAGDQLLRTVTETARTHLRVLDAVARMGGDEFALLLPETGPDAARIVIEKFRRDLHLQFEDAGWDATVSIGVLTCLSGEIEAEAAIKKADALMYEVKRSGKNAVRYQ